MTTWQINQALWVVLGLVWIIGAPLSRRTVQREPLSARLAYLGPLIVGVILLFSHLWARQFPWLELPLWPQSSAAGVAGVALTASGVGLAIWARLTLGRLWSGTITLKEGHRLVQAGPYALARHPIYTGFLLAWLGSAVTLGTLRTFLGLVLATAGFARKLAAEDRLLRTQFGDEHRDYCQRVRRLIPFVY